METFRRVIRTLITALLALMISLPLDACNGFDEQQSAPAETLASEAVSRDGSYTSKDDIALYLHTYGELPSNFISKTKARDAGWDPQKGNLDEVCPGKSIGGSIFYNEDNALPDAPNRTWHECDVNYQGGHRGPERIVYSNDGLIYYTPDHYKTFEQLY